MPTRQSKNITEIAAVKNVSVFVVQHVHSKGEDEEDVKMIGIYSSLTLANEAIERLNLQPGFKENSDGFHVDAYRINKDHWVEGFVTGYSRND